MSGSKTIRYPTEQDFTNKDILVIKAFLVVHLSVCMVSMQTSLEGKFLKTLFSLYRLMQMFIIIYTIKAEYNQRSPDKCKSNYFI